MYLVLLFFVKQKTAYELRISDWSSDVCSSGLHEYLAGDYSIADIANWSWAHSYEWSGVSIDGLDHFARWLDLVGSRDAVKRGRDVPVLRDIPPIGRASWRERVWQVV